MISTMTLTTNIIVRLQFEGVHCWPKCDIPEVKYLKHPHRHVFYIECKKEVSHDDRDVEIIMFKQKIKKYLYDNYPDGNLKSKSCEMLARELLTVFYLDYCSVLEDNENGAEIILQKQTAL